MTPHHVALASDRNYLRHAGAAALSAIEADPGTTVHLLHPPDVPATDRDRFATMAADAGGRAVLHRIDPGRVDGLAVMDRIGPVMWFRALLPELLDDVDRVVYLDADTLVVDSLAELFTMPLGDAGLAAADNVLEPAHRDRVAALGLAGSYFNSGVLVLDLDRLRRDGSMGQVLQVARERADELVWPDQDALNLVFAADRVALHPRWNAMNSLSVWRTWAEDVFGPQRVAEALRDPAVVHFEGPGQKPWFRECAHPRAQQYRGVAARTPWGRLRLARARPRQSLRHRVRRLLARARHASDASD